MATGLKIYNGSGVLITDGTQYVARVVNIVTLNPGVAGSDTNALYGQGQAFVSYQRDRTFHTSYGFGGVRQPVFVISGNTISWSWPSQNASYDETAGGIIILGVY
jgi:hypothetical protein